MVLLLVYCILEAERNLKAKGEHDGDDCAQGNHDDRPLCSGGGDEDAAVDDKKHGGFLSDLAFIKLFHFCEDNTSPIGFAMSTFEVSFRFLF